jgi:hypothetical protein
LELVTGANGKHENGFCREYFRGVELVESTVDLKLDTNLGRE